MPRNKQRRPQPGLGAVEGRSVIDEHSAAPSEDENLDNDDNNTEKNEDIAEKATSRGRKRRCVE